MNDMQMLQKQFKENITALIEKKRFEEALELIKQYEIIVPNDIELCSIKSVIYLNQGKIDYALKILLNGTKEEPDNFDINFNLGYVYEKINNNELAIRFYEKALLKCSNNEIKDSINELIKRLSSLINKGEIAKKRKVVFFVKKGMDSFIGDIIIGISSRYETRKIIVEDYNQIDEGMNWADICWFEWCDELVVHGSKLAIANEKYVICRLHSYEAFTNNPAEVNWNNIDKLILVANHIKEYLIENFNIDINKTHVIPNGVDLNKWGFGTKAPGYKVAYVGYINYKKGPMLLLHLFHAIHERDSRYKLYIAGQFQDNRDVLYFRQMVKEFNLSDCVIFEGWQSDLDKWLEDKDYILCTSLLESQNMSVMQAMAKGIKPIIHNFVGAKSIYSENYVWNSINEAVIMIEDQKYNSSEYRSFIESNYSLDFQIDKILELLNNIEKKENSTNSFDYGSYWNNRLNSKFNIEGVGYIGLGEIYNNLLYKNRLDFLEIIINKLYGNIENKAVLELGPGIGKYTEYFYRKGVKEYCGIDIAEKSAKELSSKFARYDFINGDISDKDLYKRKFDFIFTADVLLHITDEVNYEKTIKNISNSLNGTGFCILIEPITMIGAKSESPHVVIRDKQYIRNIFLKYDLEIMQILPVTFFMNYPFDRSILGDKQQIAIEFFNYLSSIFSSNIISDEIKALLGNYILARDRKMIIEKRYGLSQKIIIAKKGFNSRTIEENELNDIFNQFSSTNNIENSLRLLTQNNVLDEGFFQKIEQYIEGIQ